MYNAWQRSRANKGSTHWIEELYGFKPKFITRNIAHLTNELMMEEWRQQTIARNKAQKIEEDVDYALKTDSESGYRWLRDKRMEIRF